MSRKIEDIKNIYYNDKNEIQFEYGGQVHHHSMNSLKEMFVNYWNLIDNFNELQETLKSMTRYAIENETKIDKARADITFCINNMKNEYACTDSRTNRELHTMVKILEETIEEIDKGEE